MKKILQMILTLVLLAACVEPPKPPEPDPTPPPPASKKFFYGVTITDPYDFDLVGDSLGAHKNKLTARIVFDEFVKASDYAETVPVLAKKAILMGELLDSFYVPKYSLKQYEDRAKEYLAAFGGNVSIWEIGNEINGEWLGTSTSVIQKLEAAHRVIKAKNGVTALTLYYNPNCYEKKDNEMIPWVKKYLTAELKNNTDYVLVSYYPQDCNNYFPSTTEWNNVFNELATIFPKALLGIGESGSPRVGSSPHLTSIKQYMNYFFNISPNIPRFIGGYFWWYYNDDMISSIGNRNEPWRFFDNKMLKLTSDETIDSQTSDQL